MKHTRLLGNSAYKAASKQTHEKLKSMKEAIIKVILEEKEEEKKEEE